MAHQDVFEESKLKIKVQLKERSKKNEDTAKLILKVDGVEETPITLRVKKQWVEHEHKFKKVPDDKDNYPFSYRIEYDGEDKEGDTTCTVWPRTVNIKLINLLDDTPLPNKHFLIAVGANEPNSYQTDKSGVATCKLKHVGAVQMRSRPVLRFVKWVDGKSIGRNREAVVERVEYKAHIVEPDWATGEVEQFVNVPTAPYSGPPGHDHNGRTVAITVHLKDPKNAKAKITPRGGERVYVKVTLSDLTKRTTDLAEVPGLLGMTRVKNVITGYFVANNGVVDFELVLGFGGLEKCNLELGTTPDCTDASVKFVNKRKVWLQTISANAPPATDDARRSLLPVGIAMERDSDVTVDPTTRKAGSVIPGACLGVNGDVFIVGDHNITDILNLWKKEHDPLSAYAVFCDYQYDGDDQGELVAHARARLTTTAPTDVAVAIDGRAAILSHSLHTGQFAVTGTWTSLATQGPHANRQGALSANNFSFSSIRKPKKVTVNLPPAAAVVVNAGFHVQVDLRIVYAKGDYNGWAPSDQNTVGGVVIALNNCNGQRNTAGMNQTITHELGHLMSLVNDPAPGVGLTLEDDHGRHYVGRGHSGGHCADGIGLVTYQLGGSLSGRAGTCVMFGGAHNARKGDFCDRCRPFLLGNSLESLT